MASVGRMLLYFLGLLLVIAAIWAVYTMTGLQDIVPMGVFIAVVLLILGIGVLAAASSMRGPHAVTTERTIDRSYRSPGDRVVEERRYEDDDRF